MLIDWKELPEGPPSPGIDPRNPLVMGATAWETCVNTLRHHFVPETVKDTYGIEQVRAPLRDLGGVAPSRWSVPDCNPPVIADSEGTKAAMRFWLSQEANSDETLSLTGFGTLAALDGLPYQAGVITIQPSALLHRRHHYSTDRSLWSSMRGPKESIEGATCTATTPGGELAAVFQLPYVNVPGVATIVARRRAQGCVTIRGLTLSPYFAEYRQVARDQAQASRAGQASLESILRYPTPEWLLTGAVTEAQPLLWTVDELAEVVLVLLPIANRIDPGLARDMAQLMAVYPLWAKGPDAQLAHSNARAYARTVELAWVWMIQQRLCSMLDTASAKRLLPWAIRTAQVRFSQLEKTKPAETLLVLPYRFRSADS